MVLPSIFTRPQMVHHRLTPAPSKTSLDRLDPLAPLETPKHLQAPEVTNFTRLELVQFGNRCVIVPTILVAKKGETNVLSVKI